MVIFFTSLINVRAMADGQSSVTRHFISEKMKSVSAKGTPNQSNIDDYVKFLKSCSDQELEQQAYDYENLAVDYVSDVLSKLKDPDYNYRDYSDQSREEIIQKNNDNLSKLISLRDAIKSRINNYSATAFTANKAVLHDLLSSLDDMTNLSIGGVNMIGGLSYRYNFDGVLTGESLKLSNADDFSYYLIDTASSDYSEAIINFENSIGFVDNANNAIPTQSQSAIYQIVLSLEKRISDLNIESSKDKQEIKNLNNELASFKNSGKSHKSTKKAHKKGRKKTNKKNNKRNKRAKTAPKKSRKKINKKKASKKTVKKVKKHHKKLSKRAAKKVKVTKKAIAKINKKLKSKRLSRKHRKGLIKKRAQLKNTLRKLNK